ncbi:MAG TPA: SAM-dependent methyltransferase [Rudaea sp.]|nr:SAM-dependent methyltransferase [Rudaea sp.]
MARLQPISSQNARMPIELPEPAPDARAHSERLCALIRDEIVAAGGALDFARYMELALYAPGLGYYSAGATKFGAAGDFVTAPELGFVFARCLARAIAPTLRETRGDVLELGPGSGILAAQLLLELERLDALPACYRLLESSADLRDRQRVTLLQHCPHLEKFIEWPDAPPASPWSGTLIANEVIDALPVRAFALRDDGLFMRNVGISSDNEFVWREQPADAAMRKTLMEAVGNSATLPRPYLSEVRPMLAPWLGEVTRTLRHGSAWFIDYGYSRGEYFSPQRSTGTLRCHYQHRAHEDPFLLPGLQDITASVDFDALAQAAGAAGFPIIDEASQMQFLIAHGLDEVFAQSHAAATDELTRYRLSQEIKKLTLPGQMGEVFRVMQMQRKSL